MASPQSIENITTSVTRAATDNIATRSTLESIYYLKSLRARRQPLLLGYFALWSVEVPISPYCHRPMRNAKTHLVATTRTSREPLTLEKGSLVVWTMLSVHHHIHAGNRSLFARRVPLFGHRWRGQQADLVLARITLVSRTERTYPVTSDPTFSPITTRLMFPCLFRLKIRIGKLFSRHRLIAVASITRRPCFSTSI